MAHKVTVNVNNTNLPNGFYYQAGTSLVLTDEEFAKINPSLFTVQVAGNGINGVNTGSSAYPLTDNGVTGVAGQQVTTQGAAVAAPAALTSSQSATGVSPTQAQYNALQADVAALRTTVANLITSLSVSGGPLA